MNKLLTQIISLCTETVPHNEIYIYQNLNTIGTSEF
jgi:hypothetical protein